MFTYNKYEPTLDAFLKALPYDFDPKKLGLEERTYDDGRHYVNCEENEEGEVSHHHEFYGTKWIEENKQGLILEVWVTTLFKEDKVIDDTIDFYFTTTTVDKIDTIDKDGNPTTFWYLSSIKTGRFSFSEESDETIDAILKDKNQDELVSFICTVADIDGANCNFDTAIKFFKFSTQGNYLSYLLNEHPYFVCKKDDYAYVFDRKTKEQLFNLPLSYLVEHNELDKFVEFVENKYGRISIIEFVKRKVDFNSSRGFTLNENRDEEEHSIIVNVNNEDSSVARISMTETEDSFVMNISSKNHAGFITRAVDSSNIKRYFVSKKSMEKRVSLVEGGIFSFVHTINESLQRSEMDLMLVNKDLQNELKRQYALGAGVSEDIVKVRVVKNNSGYVLLMNCFPEDHDAVNVEISNPVKFTEKPEDIKQMRVSARARSFLSSLYPQPTTEYIWLENDGLVKFVRRSAIVSSSLSKEIDGKYSTDNVSVRCSNGSVFLDKKCSLLSDSYFSVGFIKVNSSLVVKVVTEEINFSTTVPVYNDEFDYLNNVIKPSIEKIEEAIKANQPLAYVLSSFLVELVDKLKEERYKGMGENILPF